MTITPSTGHQPKGRILTTDSELKTALAKVTRVAVLGIKTEAQEDQAAFYVAKYLKAAGLTVVPVPVYYPEVTVILDEPVYRTVSAIPGEIDVLDVFRRPKDIDAHLDDILTKRPKLVWFQLGIRNDAAATKLTGAGIDVVQDRCLMVEHRRFVA